MFSKICLFLSYAVTAVSQYTCLIVVIFLELIILYALCACESENDD